MFIDGRRLEPDTILQCEICIVGTGMGAVSVAKRLISAGRRVIFIETGPLTNSRRDSAAVHIENIGRPFGIAVNRGLEVGGGTAFWHGICAPLDEEDFLERPWITYSGWPIQRRDLAPWYAAAEEFLFGKPSDAPGVVALGSSFPLPSNIFDAKSYSYRSSPFRAKDLLQKWCTSGMAECVYNSTALQLRHEHGKAHSLMVGSGNRCFSVTANEFVIAAGALETPRLLLNSLRGGSVSEAPVSWWLGRNLIDHPVGYLSQVRFHQPFADESGMKDKTSMDLKVFPGLVLKSSVQRKHQLPNHTVFFRKGVSSSPVPNRAVMSFLGVRGTRDVRLTHLASLARHPYIVWRIANQKLGLRMRSHYGDMFFMTEQLPNPNSQVSLSEHQRDKFGFRIARVAWRLNDQDIEKFADYHALLIGSLRAHSGVRGLRVDSLNSGNDTLASGAHHLGTARMATTIKDGVVDRDLKVFGFDNIWISDGSVFPTAGSVNPSLTICALGHRLGAHLVSHRLLGAAE
jgi:choline dehydrogenase-like flavoprotein